jgi:hypothetical protein
MSSLPYEPLSWKIRLAMLAVSIVLASSVIATYGFGVRFAKLMEQVERKQAMDDAVAVATARRAAAGETNPDVVTVGIVAAKPPATGAPIHK